MWRRWWQTELAETQALGSDGDCARGVSCIVVVFRVSLLALALALEADVAFDLVRGDLRRCPRPRGMVIDTAIGIERSSCLISSCSETETEDRGVGTCDGGMSETDSSDEDTYP